MVSNDNGADYPNYEDHIMTGDSIEEIINQASELKFDNDIWRLDHDIVAHHESTFEFTPIYQITAEAGDITESVLEDTEHGRLYREAIENNAKRKVEREERLRLRRETDERALFDRLSKKFGSAVDSAS